MTHCNLLMNLQNSSIMKSLLSIVIPVLLLFTSISAQSVVGKWEVKKVDENAKLWLCENNDAYIYMFEDDMWIKGTYEVLVDKLIMHISFEGETITSEASYKLTDNKLIITADGYTDYLERSDFPNPPIYKNSNKLKVKKKANTLAEQLVVADGEQYTLELPNNTTEINLTKLQLGKYAKLIIPKNQDALLINVESFIAETGSKIIGVGESGEFKYLVERDRMRHESDMQRIIASGYNCSTGLSGADGLKGSNGSNGCNVTISAQTLNIKGLTLDLSGGVGQIGQDGQDGSNGGNGSCTCSGGNGGSGGLGGFGGDGGNGGQFKLRYKTGTGAERIIVHNSGGFGGLPGANGQAGKGGKGSYYCNDYKSYDGYDGRVVVYVAKSGVSGMQGLVSIQRVD